MDVIYPSTDVAPSGGFGELQIGELGDQDEYVEIDSDDNGAELALANDASDANGGVAARAKSMAGSSLASQEVAAVSSASPGRSSRSIVVDRPLPGVDVSLRDSALSAPHDELRTQMLVKPSGARKQGLSQHEDDGSQSRDRDAQAVSKRKGLDVEPSASTLPKKRPKLYDSRDVESQSTRKETFGGEDVLDVSIEKRPRDKTEDELQRTSDGLGKRASEEKPTAEVSLKEDSTASGLAKAGVPGDGKQGAETKRLSVPVAGGTGVFRSAFPLHARKKVHPPISGNDRSHAGARYAAHGEDEKMTWVTCVKCRKLRRVNADVNLKRSNWCCEKNTRDPKHASCSAPQDQNDLWKAGEAPADALEGEPEREAGVEELVTLNQRKDVLMDKEVARRNVVWVKVQVEGKERFWPGLQVTKLNLATQKKFEEGIEGFSGQIRVVRLFHPREGMDEFQVVKRSSVKPFHQARLSYKDSSSHPDFVTAVTAADKYYVEPDTSMEVVSQPATDSSEERTPNATEEDAECPVEDLPHEEAESNEPESDGADAPGDDPQGSQPQTDNEREVLEVGEINQVPVEEGAVGIARLRGDASPGPGLSDKRDAVQACQGTGEDEEAIRGATEQGMVQNPSESRNDTDTIGEMDDDPSQVKVVPGIDTPSKPGSGDMEVRERTRVSEASGLEEPYGSGEKILLSVELLPARRLIAYDGATKMLLFQDGSAVSIDPESLGKELGKSSTGRTLHECIHEVGRRAIRDKFPKSAKSSNGLKFSALDRSDRFAKRLRDTWLREYGDELMPEFLKTRFVAGCIMEERGESVNWAHELSRTIRQELREITSGLRKNLSPEILKPVAQLLEKQAPLPPFKAVKGEESMERDLYCQQCKTSGELLCCDGTGCRKTYHLKCLNPPLEEPPSGAFFCLSCSAEASKPTDGEVRCSPEVDDAINREEPQAEVHNLIEGAAHQLRNHGIVADATDGDEPQIGSTPRSVVDSLQTKKHVLEPSRSIDLSRASPSGLRGSGLEEVGGGSSNEQVVSLPSGIPLPENGAITVPRRNDSESELEEGEISPSEQVDASKKAAGDKLADCAPPLIPQDISSVLELPREEEEFPSSDDHNSICEGCELGGELMYVTTPSLTPTPSSPFPLCDGKGCKAVYHKECLYPPLQTVPAGEWYCPECEKGKVEKIWSVRKAGSVLRSTTDTTGSGNAPSNSENEARDDVPFGSSSQHPKGDTADTILMEYLVQWKSRSHAHDKWVPEKEVEKLAPKELARFKKSFQEGQEKYDSEWAEPERVIQKRLTRVTRRQPEEEEASGVQNAEWFVKWKGLGYEHCTWEPADTGVLAISRGLELINEFESWKNDAKQRASQESQEEAEKRVKLPMKDLDAQSEWMVRPELLPLQLEALNKLRRLWHSRTNGILVYEASQEKIVMTIMFFLSLVEEYRVVRPILVVVPKSLIQNWEHELHQWAPNLYIVNYASKSEDARGTIRRTEFSSFSEPFKPQIVLTTFEVMNCDMNYMKNVEWEALIIDEGRRHRLQKSYQKSYRPFSQIKSTFRLLLLSEPLKSNVEELIQFVNFLEPWKSVVSHGDDATQVTELQRRLAGRVLEYVPENRLTEYWVPVEMTPVQLEQYYNLLVRHYPTLSRNHRDHQIQEVVAKLRQSCNHPLLADPALNSTRTDVLDHHINISGKMRLLHLIMPILKAANWRVLIFSQESKQLDILERYMTQSHGSDSYERVDSDLATKTKEAAIQRFNAEGSKRFVLLLKTGIHISFKNVQFLLLYDSDWNPANDMRALHKIHNEGEASSKLLPVLRLYTHLTVEESTLILFRDKQLPLTRANARICQKLLTWGASKIFDRYDSTLGPSYRPKGAKFCPNAKLKQVVYNSEVVQKLLEALLGLEEGGKLESDELLDAILVPRDEPALLFAESDHPIKMIVGDSAEAFWASTLKWRHDDWQAKEVNMRGKGLRGKRPITYDEDAMATAVYTKAQLSADSERKRLKRRKGSSEEEQEGVAGPTDSTFAQANTELHATILDTEQMQENSDARAVPRSEALEPAHAPVNHDHALNRNAGSGAVREPPRRPTDMFWECLPTICAILELPRPVIERVEALLKHFIQVQKNIRKARATYEVIAIALSLVWLASRQLNHEIDKIESINKVEEKKLVTKFDNRSQLMGLLYNKVVEICSGFEPPPAVSTTAQVSLVPEASSSGASVQNPPSRAGLEPAFRSVSVQAPEGEHPEITPSLSQGKGQPIVAELPPPVVLASVQGPAPTVAAPALGEAEVEVVLVGADPRLVSDEPVQRFVAPDSNGVLVSGASMVEQEKGWLLVHPAHDALVGEPAPVPDVATPAPSVQPVRNFPAQGEALQRDQEAVAALVGGPLPEVRGVPTSEPSSSPQGSRRPVPLVRPASPTGSGSRVGPSSAERQHGGRSSSPAVPAATSFQQERGQSSLQQREGISNAQRPVVSTPAMQQQSGVQARGQLQRSNAPSHPGLTPNLQRRAAEGSRSLSTPASAPAAPPVARSSAPPSATPLAGNAIGHVYPDVLLKEKEKLSKEMESAKIAYEAESQRIKTNYDKEAEVLHRKYETLLHEHYHSYIQKQQQVQQNIAKVELNRQLAEALKLREQLAARAAVFAGLTRTTVLPFATQQPPQQSLGRQQPAGAAAVPVSRVTSNAGHTGPGMPGVAMQHPGTSSTRVSVSTHHLPIYGTPAASRLDSSRYGISAGLRNEQPRSSMSGAMAVLAASGSDGIPGNHVGAGVSRPPLETSRVHLESVPVPSLDAGADPRASGSSLPAVVAPMPLPSFQDPILSIIRNSVPSLPPENTFASPASMGMGSSLNPQSGPLNTLPSAIPESSGHGIGSGAPPDELHVIEGVEVLLSTAHNSPATQEQLAANVDTPEQPGASAAAPSRPPILIYLSDTDEE